jgi:putative acetyltransferase
MIKFIRTDSTNKDFIELVKQLDAYLAVIDGEEHSFYHQFNKIDKLKYAVVAYEDGKPIACGAIKQFKPDAMEVKRMYTIREYRGKGVASNILQELEQWASDLGYEKCVLETGKRQDDAVHLYKKRGYRIIPNYGQYEGMDNSVCFEKEIR